MGDFPWRRTFIASKFCELFKAPKIGAKKIKSTNEKPVQNLKPTNYNQENLIFRVEKSKKEKFMINNFDC